MMFRSKPLKRKGLSLVEMMAALLIFTMLVVIALNAFSVATVSLETEKKAADRSVELSDFLYTLSRDIKNGRGMQADSNKLIIFTEKQNEYITYVVTNGRNIMRNGEIIAESVYCCEFDQDDFYTLKLRFGMTRKYLQQYTIQCVLADESSASP